jgi:hypothetical protein
MTSLGAWTDEIPIRSVDWPAPHEPVNLNWESLGGLSQGGTDWVIMRVGDPTIGWNAPDHRPRVGEHAGLAERDRPPRQNRVTPFGEIVAVPERGTMMGNRGRLHDEASRIRRPWQVERWLLCRLEFNGRRRFVMAPDRYTELFFLDEATGLAAGHRPCFECRRGAFHAYAEAWGIANPGLLGGGRTTAGSIDERLHDDRVGPGRSKRTFRADIAGLPDGVFVIWGEGRDRPHLIWKGRLLAWSHGGYTGRYPLPGGEEVTVLTPKSTVDAIRTGYVPEVHLSAKGL